MSYINFKGTVKKAALKGDEIEVMLHIPSHELRGQLERLNDMIECQVIGGLDSQIVKFNKLLNAKTNKPLMQYKVDDTGVVSAVKPEGQQVEMDLGLPAEKPEVKGEQIVIELKIINDFILSGVAPRYDDLDHDFVRITRRLAIGETYAKIADDEGLALILLNMAIDEYRQRIAPLAQKWDDWRNGKVNSTPGPKPTVVNQPDPEEPIDLEDEQETEEADLEESESLGLENDLFETDDEELEFDEETESLMEDIQEPQAAAPVEITPAKIEEFILEKKPVYPDIPFDFAALLHRRKTGGDTWIEIATSLNVSSGKLQTEYQKYKAKVKADMQKGNGAA